MSILLKLTCNVEAKRKIRTKAEITVTFKEAQNKPRGTWAADVWDSAPRCVCACWDLPHSWFPDCCGWCWFRSSFGTVVDLEQNRDTAFYFGCQIAAGIHTVTTNKDICYVPLNTNYMGAFKTLPCNILFVGGSKWLFCNSFQSRTTVPGPVLIPLRG